MEPYEYSSEWVILGLWGQLTPLGQTYAENLAGRNGDRVEMVFPGKGIKKSNRLDGRTFLGIHWNNKLLVGALVGILDSEPGKVGMVDFSKRF